MTFNPVATGRKIRKLRDAARMNQYDLAAELNVSHSYISKIEIGKRIGGIDIYVAIANKFLFSGKNTKKDAVKRYRSPERNEVAGSLPPCIFITSEGDFLNKHSHSFAAALLLFNDILVSFEEYQDPTLVHDFPLFQCDRDETGDAIRKICSFFWHCIWREKNVKTIPVY